MRSGSGCPPPPSSATDRFAQRESHVRAAHLDFGPSVFRLHRPPALVVSFSFLSRSPYPYRPSACPRPRERNGSPTTAALFSAASKKENPVHHLCADSPWYAPHLRSTRCAPNPFQCILPVWLRQRVMGRLGHRHSACTCPRQRCSLPFHFVCLLARTSAPPSHLSIPLTTSPSSRPFSRGRAQARTNAARAHAQTRATTPWRNIAPVQSFCVRARARLCERSRAQACPYLLSPPLFGSFTASPCHCRVLRAEASRNHHCSIQRMDSHGIKPWTSRMLSGCDTTTPQALLHNTHTQT